MDHLPTIEDPWYPPPKVPCLCRPQDYDGQGILGFPERVGWKIDRERGPVLMDATKSSIESPGALLQSWLYYGMLCDVFRVGGLEIDVQDFIQSNDGESFVTTAALRGYLDKLATGAENIQQEVCHQRQKMVRDCLKEVFGLLEIYWDTPFLFGRWNISSVLSLDVVMSIAILGETLKNAVHQIWPTTLGPSPLREVYTARAQNPLQDRFREHGWCPNEAMMLFKELDSTGLYLASLLKRPFMQAVRHEKCCDEECVALQISESNYKIQHTDECPQSASCTNIVIEQSKISSILYSGGIPIIYAPIFPEDGSPPKAKVFDYNSNRIEYIAFSHVWAHGLGNPRQNALPSCQLLHLRHLSAKSALDFRQPAFWIDTLCIPVAPEHKRARKLAIAQLPSTFRQARRVLVLDADLQRSSKFASRTELATRIMCSGWMRRLWTLQEAVMSENSANVSKVNVQFLEAAVELNSIAAKSFNHRYHTEYAIIKGICNAFPQFQSRDRTFATLARAVEYRSTSKKEDEAICLAPILGLKYHQLSAVVREDTAEKRMQKLYTCIEQIPASILFNGEKKLGDGFRWAPASLIGSSAVKLSLDGVAAKCDESGLHVQFAGYVVTGNANQQRMTSRLLHDRVCIGERQNPFPKAMIIPDTRYHHRLAYNESIVFEQLIKETRTAAFIINPRDRYASVLVSVMSEIDGVIHATYLGRIGIRFFHRLGHIDDKGEPKWGSSSFNAKIHEGWQDDLVDTHEVLSDQRWCIT